MSVDSHHVDGGGGANGGVRPADISVWRLVCEGTVALLMVVAIAVIGWNLVSATPATSVEAVNIEDQLQSTPVPTRLNGRTDRAVGSVVVIEVSDFQCPFCRRFAQGPYQRFRKEFVATGQVSYAFIHLPIESIHNRALAAAIATECARDQFWNMHDQLFAGVPALQSADLVRTAAGLGLGEVEFNSCMESASIEANVRGDIKEAERLGIRSTPTLLVGAIDEPNRVSLKRKFSGVASFEALRDSVAQVRSATFTR